MNTYPRNTGSNDPGDQSGRALNPEQTMFDQSVVALSAIIGECVIAGRSAGETAPVTGGEKRQIEIPGEGVEVYLVNYNGEGSQQHAEDLDLRSDIPVDGATIRTYVNFEADLEGPMLSYDLHLLSDGRAIGILKMSAFPIGSLNRQEGTYARQFAEDIGLELPWMSFEQEAHHRSIIAPGSALKDGFRKQQSFELTSPPNIDAVSGYLVQHLLTE